MNEELIKYWDEMHSQNNKMFLAGSSFDDVMNDLNIPEIHTDTNVLLIGVGMGYELHGLYEITKKIDVMDISKVALERSAHLSRNQFMTSEITELIQYKYDLVISHLVTQHMTDCDLELQLYHVIRALKYNGVFAMQFATDHDEKRSSYLIHSIESQKAGTVFRSLKEIEKYVDENSGYIDWVSPEKKFDHTPIVHQFVHIKRLTK